MKRISGKSAIIDLAFMRQNEDVFRVVGEISSK